MALVGELNLQVYCKFGCDPLDPDASGSNYALLLFLSPDVSVNEDLTLDVYKYIYKDLEG